MDIASVAVSATFTAEPLQGPLEFWLEELKLREPGSASSVRFAPFSQVFQTLLDPAGLFAENRGGFNVVLVRIEDLFAHDASDAQAAEAVDALQRAVEQARKAYGNRVLVRVCLPSPAFQASSDRAKLAAALETEIATPRFRVAAVENPHDLHAAALGAIPYTAEYFAALATSLAREIHALSMTPFKVIALDCDNTLWSGVCGEDGPSGVGIDPPYRRLQKFMRDQRAQGKLLVLASKNNERDVRETFAAHSDMPLRFEDFTAHRIDWSSKAISLASLSEELRLDLDAFIFVDDNPKECAEAAAELPGLVTLALPSDASQLPAFLDSVWAFDSALVTEEDRNRSVAYAQESERARFEASAGSLEEFIAGLQLAVEISPLKAEQVPRVAQLTQRTNQMNFSTRRRDESAVRALLRTDDCLTVRARDRFGDYGLVGVMIFDRREDALGIETFLLSCRALGRGVEHRMLRRVGCVARERGLAEVEIEFAETARNAPARELIEELGAMGKRIAASTLENLVYRPGKRSLAQNPQAMSRPRVARPDYRQIATQLTTPSQVLAAMRRKLQHAAPHTSGTKPRSPLEQQLAAIWSDLLHLPSVGIDENFFDLGGHSLLAVQLVSRIHKDLGIDVPLDAVYTGTLTIEELARSIEILQLGTLDSERYADLLAEIENLSDDEAEALLARELPAR